MGLGGLGPGGGCWGRLLGAAVGGGCSGLGPGGGGGCGGGCWGGWGLDTCKWYRGLLGGGRWLVVAAGGWRLLGMRSRLEQARAGRGHGGWAPGWCSSCCVAAARASAGLLTTPPRPRAAGGQRLVPAGQRLRRLPEGPGGGGPRVQGQGGVDAQVRARGLAGCRLPRCRLPLSRATAACGLATPLPAHPPRPPPAAPPSPRRLTTTTTPPGLTTTTPPPTHPPLHPPHLPTACRSIVYTATSGKFSSDRTIVEYAQDIWKVGPARPQ